MRYIKIIILFINLLYIDSCTKEGYFYENDEIFYEWVEKKHKLDIKKNEVKITVKLEYFIKNKSEKDIWLYDQENGNLWQKIKPSVTNNTIESQYIMYREWIYPPPYDYNAPKSIYIKPNESINGLMQIRYYIFSEKDNFDLSNITIQRFNFFILDQDISTHKDDENTVKNIVINHSKSYKVELPIRLVRQSSRCKLIKNDIKITNHSNISKRGTIENNCYNIY